MQRAEAHLAVEFPEQVARFWLAFDGLEVLDPPFKILPLSEMKRNGELLTFCYCDRTAEISFDVRAHNQAAQWSIVNASTRYVVTFTLASFWSTHLWSWILKRRTFWHERAASEGSPIR
ncbi:MAG TPA: hypothetical protein VKZ53_19255 [Candidatus Angelobacter sp.]|nr:hypothetical protein [Candidatus Angelobacter sp.]